MLPLLSVTVLIPNWMRELLGFRMWVLIRLITMWLLCLVVVSVYEESVVRAILTPCLFVGRM